MQNLPNIKDVTDLQSKRVIVRLPLNVPIENGVVRNRFRLDRVLPTIKWLQEQGARVIIIGHIGRNTDDTLRPVFDTLSSSMPNMVWCGGLVSEAAKQCVANLQDGQIAILENLRQDKRETENDDEFAKELASHADIYVNEAFAASHRSHASIVGLPKYLPSYFGPEFVRECEELSKALDPENPSLFILGGSKFDTKIPLIEKFADTYTKVLIAGALANDVYKARGFEIGTSLTSDIDLNKYSILHKTNVTVPVDVVVSGKDGERTVTPDQVKSHEKIVDAGPQTIGELKKYLKETKTILWNGPLGYYEGGFDTYTEALAMAIAEAPGYSMIGGGDTIASIEDLKIENKFNFLSTGGGAMLTFLEYGTLPAIKAVLG